MAPTLLDLPAILFEGDEPILLCPAPGPAAPPLELTATEDLPSTIGKGKLWLTARDPQCLYATWIFSEAEHQAFNRLSMHHHLVLRCIGISPSRPVAEIHLHPDSQHWFIQLEHPGGDYLAELGFYTAPGQWRAVAVSPVAQVPMPTISALEPVRFVRVDPDMPLAAPTWAEPHPASAATVTASTAQPTEPVRTPPPALNIVAFPTPSEPFREPSMPGAVQPMPAPVLTEGQEQVLHEIFVREILTHRAIGSIELEELLRTPIPGGARILPWMAGMPEMGSQAAAGLPEQPGGEIPLEMPSSLALAGEAPIAGKPAFWFQVNAEVILYGATEPNARVTIAGRPVQLRPDGSFTFRFALPDGDYGLPVTAESVHGDRRQASVRFLRSTALTGEVGVHPQDPALKPPRAESIV